MESRIVYASRIIQRLLRSMQHRYASFEAFIERHPQILGPSSHALHCITAVYQRLLPNTPKESLWASHHGVQPRSILNPLLELHPLLDVRPLLTLRQCLSPCLGFFILFFLNHIGRKARAGRAVCDLLATSREDPNHSRPSSGLQVVRQDAR